MNIKLLKQIRKQILKEPKQFYMGEWFTTVTETHIPNCGTAACIGGWAIALAKKVNPAQAHDIFLRNTMLPEELLELECDEAERLFYTGNWPQEFTGGSTPAIKAKKAAARIDHFIKTEGME